MLTRRKLFDVAISLTLLCALLSGCASAAGPSTASGSVPRGNPLYRDGVAQPVAFYYTGTVPLRSDRAPALRRILGSPKVVVTTPKDDGPIDAKAVKAIHAIGAKAYLYVQYYWAPTSGDYEGISLPQHPDWAFCRGAAKHVPVGRVQGGGTVWHYLDTNETAVRARIATILRGYRNEGWDGVFFDRGQAATQYAYDIHHKPIWDRVSSCTAHPYQRGATFADAYANTLGLARHVGLKVIVNNGSSPFDPTIRMRPDPHNRACRNANWSRCHFLSDEWNDVNLVLSETASAPKDERWWSTFTGNGRSERNRRNGHRTIALITTANLGGVQNQTRKKIFYAWGRVRLFNMPVAINTGNDRCAGGKQAICNRFGAYPKLTDHNFGRPITSRPESTKCGSVKHYRCVWIRRYTKGAVVVNVSPVRHRVRVALGRAHCRHVYDMLRNAPLAGDRCVRSVTFTLKPWSAHPLRYRR